jgi:hypothetical protein
VITLAAGEQETTSHKQEAAMAAQQDQTIKATLSATSADFPGFASFATHNVVLKPSTKNAAIVKVTNLKLPDLENPGNAVMQAFLQVCTDPGTPDGVHAELRRLGVHVTRFVEDFIGSEAANSRGGASAPASKRCTGDSKYPNGLRWRSTRRGNGHHLPRRGGIAPLRDQAMKRSKGAGVE